MIYTTIRQAKNLRELGFKDVCVMYYDESLKRYVQFKDTLNAETRRKLLAIPDMYQAKSWLFEKFGELPTILLYNNVSGNTYIYPCRMNKVNRIPFLGNQKFLHVHNAELAALTLVISYIKKRYQNEKNHTRCRK